MKGPMDLLPLAQMLETAYRLALVVHDDLPSNHACSRQAAVELIDVLDDARVSLLNACCSSRSVHPPPPDSFISEG